jgi:hypothetical protein
VLDYKRAMGPLEREISDYLDEKARNLPMMLDVIVHGEDHPLEPKTAIRSLFELIEAQRNALVRLGREIDQINATLDRSS